MKKFWESKILRIVQRRKIGAQTLPYSLYYLYSILYFMSTKKKTVLKKKKKNLPGLFERKGCQLRIWSSTAMVTLAKVLRNQYTLESEVDTAAAATPPFWIPKQYALGCPLQWTAVYHYGPMSSPIQHLHCSECVSHKVTLPLQCRILINWEISDFLDYLLIETADGMYQQRLITPSNCSIPWPGPAIHSSLCWFAWAKHRHTI